MRRQVPYLARSTISHKLILMHIRSRHNLLSAARVERILAVCLHIMHLTIAIRVEADLHAVRESVLGHLQALLDEITL